MLPNFIYQVQDKEGNKGLLQLIGNTLHMMCKEGVEKLELDSDQVSKLEVFENRFKVLRIF